ncbi:MAG: flagellar hook-associated protein FlgL [Bdellovibrionales bacterium]|nr:flagellar hook-associated protein FlgL [Bdellovibrionales bacterium]
MSDNTNFGTVRETINRTKGRMENLQTQSATLRKLNTPSDDPVGAAKVLEIRTDKVNNEQFLTNAKIAEAQLNNTESAIAELADIVVRAKEIALQQASGASANDDTRLAVAEEITQLYQSAIGTANRRIGDRYVFGGYKTDKPPVTVDGKYTGDDGQMMVEVGRDVFIAMNLPGNEVFNTNPKTENHPADMGQSPELQMRTGNRAPASYSASGKLNGAAAGPQPENVNVFEELQNLRIGLLTSDTETIRNTLDRFDQMHTRLNSMRAKIGSRINGLQTMAQSLERQNITHAQLGSHIEDADMAEVVSNLAKEETVFRSALQSSNKLLQPTLMDFLK